MTKSQISFEEQYVVCVKTHKNKIKDRANKVNTFVWNPVNTACPNQTEISGDTHAKLTSSNNSTGVAKIKKTSEEFSNKKQVLFFDNEYFN